jgi:hypothetical protein
MLTVENVTLGTQHDIWTVNVESDYHEKLNQTPSGRATEELRRAPSGRATEEHRRAPSGRAPT